MPTEEEKTQILEAQMSNADVPLGSAENFLLTLGSISDLEQRLRLWAFTLEYDATEAVSLIHFHQQSNHAAQQQQQTKFIQCTEQIR